MTNKEAAELKIGGEVFVLCILIGGISNVMNRGKLPISIPRWSNSYSEG